MRIYLLKVKESSRPLDRCTEAVVRTLGANLALATRKDFGLGDTEPVKLNLHAELGGRELMDLSKNTMTNNSVSRQW